MPLCNPALLEHSRLFALTSGQQIRNAALPTPQNRPLTLRDVSDACGVSEMTVSRVLRNRGDVSAATRERVLKAAKELGYVPNQIAGSLASQRRVLYEMLSWRPSGVIIAGLEHTDATRAMMRNAGIPVVEIMDVDGTPVDAMVGISHRRAGLEMARRWITVHANGSKGLPKGSPKPGSRLRTARSTKADPHWPKAAR